MVMEFFRGSSETGLEHVEHQVAAMLADTRHGFDAAMSALVGGADPKTLDADVHATDERVNVAERRIRGELVVHASVHGSAEIGTVLTYMLVIKKIERIGDQTLNIFDLADEGIDLSGSPDLPRLLEYRDTVSSMFTRAAEIFAERDAEGAKPFFEQGDVLLAEFNETVRASLHSEDSATVAVPRALLARYLKRIAANLLGVVSAALNPVTGIDDEGPEEASR